MGDVDHFCEYIQRNIALYRIRNRVELSTHGVANFMRGEMAQFLRRSPYQVNVLLAGYDETEGAPSLYWMDYLAALQKVKFGAQGYCSYFLMSVMDRFYQDDMTEEQAI